VTGTATLVITLAADHADTTDPYTDVFGTDFGVDFNVRGKKGGLTDLRRNLIDGEPDGEPGGEPVFRFRVFSGTAVTVRDLDGDPATLVLTGGGRLDGIVPIGAPERRTPKRQLTIEPNGQLRLRFLRGHPDFGLPKKIVQARGYRNSRYPHPESL